MIIDEIKNIETTQKKIVSFSLILGAFFFILAAILWRQGDSFVSYLTIGILFIVSGAIDPFILAPLYKIWMSFAIILNWIMLRMILCFLFYIAFLFVKIAARLCGKQFLVLKWDKEKISYWNIRKHETFTKNKYEQQF